MIAISLIVLIIFFCILFVCVQVAMFAKTWQIRKLYREIFQKQKLSIEIIGLIEVMTTIGVVLTIQIIILIIWSSVSPVHAVRVIFDPINLSAQWECQCDNPSTWIIV